MVKIRLKQTGTTNRKTYRIIAIDSKRRRDGKAIETLGYVDPLVKPAKIVVDRQRVDYWLGTGAQMTDGVAKVLADVAS